MVLILLFNNQKDNKELIYMKVKKEEPVGLCFRYATNCKFCPRNRKCNEEIDKEERKKKVKVRRNIK
jgi:hypothetical protein